MRPKEQKAKLSVVVITLDEEADLPGFLENFLTIADEILIIDDGSTDRTKEIAEAAGEKVRFVSSPRKKGEGFCDQRQKGVEAAQSEWLLQVDCDMRLTAALASEISEAIQHGDFIAYRFRLRQYFMNHHVRYGGFQYWNQPWLSRRGATSWTQKVHERICISGNPKQIGQLSARMIHLNDMNFMERLRKNRQYSELEAQRLIDAGEDFTFLKIFYIPFWRFVRSYIVMRGFMDGAVGFVWGIYQFTSNATIYFIGWDRKYGGSRAANERSIAESMQGYNARNNRQ